VSDEGERTGRQHSRYRGHTAGRHRDPIEANANGRVGADAGRRDEGGAGRSIDDGQCETDHGDPKCRCSVTFHGDQLIVDSEACPERGRLADSPACRETVIEALSIRDAVTICTRVDDTERACGSDAAGFLLAAGRFAELCTPRDPSLAARVRRDPLTGARLAAARSDYTSRIAAETGFLEGAVRFGSYREAFGDRDAYRVRNVPQDSDGCDPPRSDSETDNGSTRAEHTAHALDDGEAGQWHRRRHDGSSHVPR